MKLSYKRTRNCNPTIYWKKKWIKNDNLKWRKEVLENVQKHSRDYLCSYSSYYMNYFSHKSKDGRAIISFHDLFEIRV